jgi:hypothetical protein
VSSLQVRDILAGLTFYAGYPPPDVVARDFLTQTIKDQDNYNLHVQAFLIGMLSHINQLLTEEYSDGPPSGGEAEIAKHVRNLFEEGGSKTGHSEWRSKFYEDVVDEARKVRLYMSQCFPHILTIDQVLDLGKKEVVPEKPAHAAIVMSPKKSRLTTGTRDDAKATGSTGQIPFEKTLLQIVDEFLKNLSKLFGKERDGPLLTLSWDEAHVLTDHVFDTSRKPARWTQFNEFRRVLRDCDQTGRLFSLFLSTTGKIDQFSPDSRDDPSQRLAKNQLRLLPPFINLDFDQFADGLVDPEDGFSLEEAVKPEWMVKFGRPLWVFHLSRF